MYDIVLEGKGCNEFKAFGSYAFMLYATRRRGWVKNS